MAKGIGTVLWMFAMSAVACGELETQTAVVESAGVVDPPCPDWGCGTNTATVFGNLSFHELSTCGVPNAAGLTLVDATKDTGPFGTHVQLSVVGDQLLGHVGGEVLQGTALLGLTLNLASPSGAVRVTIAAVGSTDYWVSPGPPVPTYTLTWQGTAAGQMPRALCGLPPAELPDEWWDLTGGDAALAIVFAGDRYDGAHKTVVSEGPADSASTCWFNIACAGSAAAKLHLLRHTVAGSDTTHRTTLPQRQAMLKMITDDICGTGESFTVNGEGVYYEDMRRWHPFPEAPESIEALWDDRGAMCLDVPRRQREDPLMRSRIQRACALASHDLPACPISRSDYDTWPILARQGGYGYGLSANPRDTREFP
jgi:hypothetical protein